MTSREIIQRIRTSNLVEVGYLIDRGHRIVDATVEPSPPYDVDELYITMEGPNIDIDRRLGLQTRHTITSSILWNLSNTIATILEHKELDRSSLSSEAMPL